MNVKDFIRGHSSLYRPCSILFEKYYKYQYQKYRNDGRLCDLLAKYYKSNIGRDLRIPPVSYTEKMQFAKVFDLSDIKSMLTDKYEVRRWIKNKIGAEYLIPLLGVWDNPGKIDFDVLPNSFVLKTNNGSGTNIIVGDKNRADISKIKEDLRFWMNRDFAFWGKGFELHYSKIVPKVIAEKYVNDKTGELKDYKFLCFDGIPYYCWVDFDRYSRHKRNIYDLSWTLQPWSQYSYGNYEGDVSKPKNFENMVEIARVLSEGFSHVRVDLYNVDGKIYFGEMTFTNGKGYCQITPTEYDDMLGSLWKQEFKY